MVYEEGLAEVAFVDVASEGIHEVGVAEIYFFGVYEMFVVFQVLGEEEKETGAVQEVEEFETLVASCLELGSQLGDVGDKRHVSGDYGQQLFCFLQGGVGEVLDGRDIGLDDEASRLAEA